MNSVLVLGGGGREDALSWKLSQSPEVEKVFVYPGNAGTFLSGNKILKADLPSTSEPFLSSWCKQNNVPLVVIGPEDFLAEGLVDKLTQSGIKCFGPTKKAAQIESSKKFSKSLMDRNGIPTARWFSFTDQKAACDFIQKTDFEGIVVKASGLASGKGVVVASSKSQACLAANQILQEKIFGKAGEILVVEEELKGEEISCLAFCDGKNIIMMPPCQDHKRVAKGDQGPNTGGMGAFCPVAKVDKKTLEIIEKEIIQKTVDALEKEGSPFVGVLYAGMMLTSDGPRVLEFNCRFGDPETQALMPLLESDLYKIMRSCVEGCLTSDLVKFSTDKYALGIVLASEGYPGQIKRKGVEIKNLDKINELNSSSFSSSLHLFHSGTKITEGKVVTNGGRILTLVAVATSLKESSKLANKAAGIINFEGKQFREDIGWRSLGGVGQEGVGDQRIDDQIINSLHLPMTYKNSGVDIDEGEKFIEKIKPFISMTTREGCRGTFGSFASLFDPFLCGFKQPLLVSGTDGVGTKLKVAMATKNHKTIGIDLVAMCVNDILCHGAEPLFFLDYFSCGKLKTFQASDVIEGISNGCREAGCALVGGETAEMPSMYQGEDYDLAGFAVGAVEKDFLLPLETDPISRGDVLVGLSSSGIHSNGFSLVRKVMERSGLGYHDNCPFFPSKTMGDILLTPTLLYVASLLPLMKKRVIKACAHITGGGIPGNLARVFPTSNLSASLDASKWEIPAIFNWIQIIGNIEENEMLKTFNCGLGMILVVPKQHVAMVTDQINKNNNNKNIKAYVVGEVVERDEKDEGIVIVKNLMASFHNSTPSPIKREISNLMNINKKKVAVLISGSGTNLQALIEDSLGDPSCPYIIHLVLSNVPNVLGLKRASKNSIKTKVISHKEFKIREDFDSKVEEVLREEQIDLVCLAGFMRILSDGIVKNWEGKMLNIHPSLLPLFKGLHVHRQALQAGVQVSGCTVHFVSNDLDGGAILVQETVPVLPGDSENDLAERVKTVEHKAFPKALRLLSSGKAQLSSNGKILWS